MAEGIIRLANEHMARELRVMSVQRGIDPHNLTLVSFGGAGGLHVCALAEALSMNQAMVPVHAGVLSALGMLAAPRARHLSQTISGMLQDVDEGKLAGVFTELTERGNAELRQEGLNDDEINVLSSVDVRYQGQSYSLNIPWLGREKTLDSFHFDHERRYGHRLEQPVELVTARVKVYGKTAHLGDLEKFLQRPGQAKPASRQQATLYGIGQAVPVIAREQLGVKEIIDGPALITETVSTTYIAPGWWCQADNVGNLMLQGAGT
jgi:N-methylhydantoinase A